MNERYGETQSKREREKKETQIEWEINTYVKNGLLKIFEYRTVVPGLA